MEVEHTTGRVTARSTQARVAADVARRALDRVEGMAATDAVQSLTFSAGHLCEPVARLIDAALAHATRVLHVPAALCVVESGEVGEGETVVRVRRQAHGLATWITTRTTSITVVLSVPILHSVSA
ncbi:50S ribosomal protein L22 [Pseudonocardia benzenivorans]|jgi:large subunit ribosomal protein L22|nr:uL22 family ribosomal protein [Pseudonocardia dioxanivorans]GJF06071.1 hypothetical protein PSD17_50190 [Pseudonocardia sp. D17]